MKLSGRWFIAVGVVMLLAIAAVYYRLNINTVTASSSPSKADSAVARSKAKDDTSIRTLSDVPPFPVQPKALVSIETIVQQRDIPAPDFVLADLGPWAAAASRGDARAAVALSRSLDACLVVQGGSESSTSCVAVPEKLRAVARDSLEAAAAKGDPIAKLDLGLTKHSELLLKNEGRASLTPESYSSALRHLQDLTALGVQESFLALSAIYAKGTLANRDEVKSAAYLLVLSELDGGQSYSEMAAKRSAGLSSASKTRLEAEVQAIKSKCCQ
jgi:hypothetical protein